MPDQGQPKKGKKISGGMIAAGVIALGLGIWWYTKHQSSSSATDASGAAGTASDGMVSGVPAASGIGDNGQDLDQLLRDQNGHPPRRVREAKRRKRKLTPPTRQPPVPGRKRKRVTR